MDHLCHVSIISDWDFHLKGNICPLSNPSVPLHSLCGFSLHVIAKHYPLLCPHVSQFVSPHC